jgi:hypothetical protein
MSIPHSFREGRRLEVQQVQTKRKIRHFLKSSMKDMLTLKELHLILLDRVREESNKNWPVQRASEQKPHTDLVCSTIQLKVM